MIVVSGEYGGRTLVTPKSKITRPMSHKLRAALFDSLGPIDGFKMIDAYAGSGALGIEALSRGAAQVDVIESAGTSLQAIKANQKALGIDWGYSVYPVSVERWLAGAPQGGYNLVTADPNYADVADDVLEGLGRLLKEGGRLVLSHSGTRPAPILEDLELTSSKRYGDSALSYYRK